MRHTEFWERMGAALGRGNERAWAGQVVLADLDDRTVSEALDAGVPAKEVWAVVWRALELPARDR